MKVLKNNFDKDIMFNDLAEAKKYYSPDLDEFPEQSGYAKEIEAAENLDELAEVFNKYTDVFGNGSEFFVKEI